MENAPSKIEALALAGLSQSRIAKYESAAKLAIKVEHGIDGTSIVKFVDEVGLGVAKSFIATLLVKQCQFFNLVDNLSDAQAVEIAGLIVTEYPNMTVEDIVVCFRWAKTGKEGFKQPMSRIDGRLIFDWINEYLHEKYRRIEEQRAAESFEHKQGGAVASEVLERIGQIVKTEETPAKKYPFPASFEKQKEHIRQNVHAWTVQQIKDLIARFHTLSNYEETYADTIQILQDELDTR